MGYERRVLSYSRKQVGCVSAFHDESFKNETGARREAVLFL